MAEEKMSSPKPKFDPPQNPKNVLISKKQRKSILTSVSKRVAKLHKNWKNTAVILIFHILALIFVVLIVACVLIPLQRYERRLLYEKCTASKEELKNKMQDVCMKNGKKACDEIQLKSRYELAACYGYPIAKPKPPNTFWRALIYTYSICTTIGFGNVAATNSQAKIFTVFVAVVGVPMFFGFVVMWGQWLHYILVSCYDQLRRLCNRIRGKRNTEELLDTQNHDTRIFLFVCCLLFLYTCFTARLYQLVQSDWTFIKAFYFAFQCMTMIGFGDVFPDVDNTPFLAIFVLCNTVGIILMSSYVFVVQEWMRKAVRNAAVRLVERCESRGRKVIPAKEQSKNMVKISASPQPLSETEMLHTAKTAPKSPQVFNEDDTLKMKVFDFSFLDNDPKSTRRKTVKCNPKSPTNNNALSVGKKPNNELN